MIGLFTLTIFLPSVAQKHSVSPFISSKTPRGPAAAVAPSAGDNW